MLQADLAAPTAAPDLADAVSGGELRLAMLKRLASLGMRVAEELAERTVNSPYHPEPRHEPGRAFAAIARAVRLTIVLEARVEADLFALRRGEVPKATAAPAVRPLVPAQDSDDDAEQDLDDTDGGVEAIARERTWECLVDREDDDALVDRPFDEAVAAIRADLGLVSRPGEDRPEAHAARSASLSPAGGDRAAPAPVLAARVASALPIRGRAEDDP